MVNPKPLPGGKKSRKELTGVSKPEFSPVKIEIKDPSSLILLLSSQETTVVIQALSALVHYASKSEESSTILVKDGIMSYLLPHLSSQDLCCQRYTYRLLTYLVFNKNTQILLLENHGSIYKNIFNTLIKAQDVTLQEYASKILSILSRDKTATAYLNDLCPVETLIKYLSTGDPDIEKNILETLVSYLRDPSSKPSKEFNFQPLLQLVISEYPIIQNLVLDVLIELTDRCKDLSLKELFRNAGGVGKLLPLLEKFDWSDLHPKVLKIVANLAETHDELECIKPNDVSLLVTYTTKTVDVKNLEQAWLAIIKIANLESGRKILKGYQILQKMIPMLNTENESLLITACTGIVKFMQEYDTMEEIMALNPVPGLLSILHHEHGWDSKEAALVAIKEGLRRHRSFHRQVTEKYELIQSILDYSSKDTPAEILKTALECITLLAQEESFRKMLHSSIMKKIVKVFQETEEDGVRVAALNALNQLVYEGKLSNAMKENLVEIIWKTVTLHSYSYPTALAAAHFIEVSSKNYHHIATAFIKAGSLLWMLQCKDLQRAPTWKTAINVLFSNHLSAKFAYRGHLEFTDIIKDQFYTRKEGLSAEKQMAEKFPVFDEVLKIGKDQSHKPIYLVNIQLGTTSNNIERTSNSSSLKSGKSVSLNNKVKDTKSGSIKESNHSSLLFHSDEYLSKYIEQVKKLLEAENQILIKKFGENESALSASDTEARAKIIGKYVWKQLSGPDPKVPCTTHYLNLHIQQLKEELGSSLIPLGLLRAGLAMERALLFKVLADQVGLPCTLVRGQYSQAWVELSVPVLSSPPTPCLPKNLLKPTHVVDLLHSPVTLLPIGSFAANKYTTCPSLSAY